MFTTQVDKKTIQEANALLIAGGKLKDVAAKTGLTYAQTTYIRKKLVNAGALNPLYKTTRKRSKRTTTRVRTKRVTSVNNTTTASNTATFKLVVNGTAVDVRNVKSIFVSPELVDIKY